MLPLAKSKAFLQQPFTRLFSTTMGSKWLKSNPQEASVQEDQLILVDQNDQVIGGEGKALCHTVSPDGNLLLHRAFSLFLFNTKGELLLQKRSSVKVTYADHYTNTCCSHPLSTIPNEGIEKDALGIRNAAQRRLWIELGIPPEQARPEEMKYLTRIHYFDRGDGKYGEHEIDYMLFLQKDVDVKPNPDEVSEVRYIKRSEIDSFLNNVKEPITPWFALICKHKLKLWWDNLHQLEKLYDHGTIHRYV